MKDELTANLSFSYLVNKPVSDSNIAMLSTSFSYNAPIVKFPFVLEEITDLGAILYSVFVCLEISFVLAWLAKSSPFEAVIFVEFLGL